MAEDLCQSDLDAGYPTTRTTKRRMCASHPGWVADFQFDTHKLWQFHARHLGASLYLRLTKGGVRWTDLDSSRALRTVSRSSWEQHVLHSAVQVLESDAVEMGPTVLNATPPHHCIPIELIVLRLFILPNQHPPDVSFRFLTFRRGTFTWPKTKARHQTSNMQTQLGCKRLLAPLVSLPTQAKLGAVDARY